jgi:hypothetical protein
MITIFFYIFLWMIVTLATNKNSFKKRKKPVNPITYQAKQKQSKGGDIPEIKGLRQGER